MSRSTSVTQHFQADTAVKFVKVAIAIVTNKLEQILIAKRPKHLQKGGYWEFPGGKIEQKETSEQALIRELHEELGITATQSQLWFLHQYSYPEFSVELHVWRVTKYVGKAEGREGQVIKWVGAHRLKTFKFLEANAVILDRI